MVIAKVKFKFHIIKNLRITQVKTMYIPVILELLIIQNFNVKHDAKSVTKSYNHDKPNSTFIKPAEPAIQRTHSRQ